MGGTFKIFLYILFFIVFIFIVGMVSYLSNDGFKNFVDSNYNASRNKIGVGDINIRLNTDKSYTTTSLEITSSTCKSNDTDNKNFTCNYMEDSTYHLIFKADKGFIFEDDITIKKEDKSYNISVVEDKDIKINDIRLELSTDRKNLKGQLFFNKLKNKSDIKLQIGDNTISCKKINNRIDFEIDNWDTVIKPNNGFFLDIQIDNKKLLNLPKYHYSKNDGKIFNVKEDFKILADKSELNDFFIYFYIFNLKENNILILKNNDKKLLRIGSTKSKKKIKINEVTADNVQYDGVYEVVFNRVQDVNNTNKFNCSYKITNLSIANVKSVTNDFDCTYEFGSNFIISSDTNNYNFKIGDLITGKNRDTDFSLLNNNVLKINTKDIKNKKDK